MAITFPLVTLADGALISKTFIDAVVDDINHLSARPDEQSIAFGGAFNSNSTTFVQMTTPSITITPKITGNILIIYTIGLQSSVAGDLGQVRLDVNGSKIGDNFLVFQIANYALPLTSFIRHAVTADVAYTIKLEFARATGSGTVTSNINYYNRIYAIEV